jgi:hypothetical protein
MFFLNCYWIKNRRIILDMKDWMIEINDITLQLCTIFNQIRRKLPTYSDDLYICLVYYPPSGSAYTQGLDMDILDCIEKDISTYKMSGDILLCGDFNARTASEPDFIVNDDNSYSSTWSRIPSDTIT